MRNAKNYVKIFIHWLIVVLLLPDVIAKDNKMKIETFSIVAGGTACNAHCPFCVSKMTPKNDLDTKAPPINWRVFNTALRLTQRCNVTTALVSGKGEPTLYSKLLLEYVKRIDASGMPFIELQTNGILLNPSNLLDLYLAGLTTVCISCVSYKTELNKANYSQQYRDLSETIKMIHDAKLSCRLSVVVIKNHIDTFDEFKNMIEFAKVNKVEQMTLTPISFPKKSINEEVAKWSWDNKTDFLERYAGWLSRLEANQLMILPHGAIIFDVGGQNVCISNCLMPQGKGETLRNLIFDGKNLRFDWQFKGAILL